MICKAKKNVYSKTKCKWQMDTSKLGAHSFTENSEQQKTKWHLFFWIDYLQYSKFGQRVLKTSYVRKRLCVCKIQVCIIIPFLKKNLCVIYFTDNIQIPSSHCGLLEEKHCRRQLRCLTKIILCYFKDFDSGLMIERFAYNLRYSLQTNVTVTLSATIFTWLFLDYTGLKAWRLKCKNSSNGVKVSDRGTED